MAPHDRPGQAMAVLGAASVIAGGLVAAVTAPLALARGSWLAAYLVLVAGVAQIAMAAARLLAPNPHAERLGWLLLAAWNLGNALVITGTLTGRPLVVDAGGLACVVALVLALRQAAALPGVALVWFHRIVLGVLIVSIPVGLVLSHLRHGG